MCANSKNSNSMPICYFKLEFLSTDSTLKKKFLFPLCLTKVHFPGDNVCLSTASNVCWEINLCTPHSKRTFPPRPQGCVLIILSSLTISSENNEVESRSAVWLSQCLFFGELYLLQNLSCGCLISRLTAF